MSEQHLEYALEDNYIHNWLVAGPQATALGDAEVPAEGELRRELVQRQYRRYSEVNQPPVELGTFQVDDTELTWEYYRCEEDHLIDLSSTYPRPHYLRTWAYARIECPSLVQVTFQLTTHGPATELAHPMGWPVTMPTIHHNLLKRVNSAAQITNGRCPPA